jgi:hypothetical protein
MQYITQDAYCVAYNKNDSTFFSVRWLVFYIKLLIN